MPRALNRASQFMDEPNEYRILRLVRDSQTISRTEIARLCKLSKPTVSDIVGRFLTEGFLQSVGESESTARGGRKRELLRFNPHAGYVVGVDIRRIEATVALTDLNANILSSERLEYSLRSAASDVLSQVARAIGSLLGTKRAFTEKCVGIGIGLPGLIDHRRGIVRVADTLRGWDGVNLQAFFYRRFSIPVYVDNDVKARAIAEFLFGAGRARRDQILLYLGAGIGVGIILDGKLHRGITESAGEIGYNALDVCGDGKKKFSYLYTGQRDFGEILSNDVIIGRYGFKTKTKGPTMESLFADARKGLKTANRILDEVATLISILCVNLINTLNPELIILGGKITEAGNLVLDRVRRKIHSDYLRAPAEAVTIVPSHLKKDGVVLGAVGLVLYDLFKPARNGMARPVYRPEPIALQRHSTIIHRNHKRRSQ